jgi:outer membrane protein OmpA-like peptidoglycan-associated protein
MSRIILIPIVLLFTWLGGGTWYWACQMRGLCGKMQDAMEVHEASLQTLPSVSVDLSNQPAALRQSLTITYHDKMWMDVQDHLRFARDQSEAALSKRMNMALEKLAFYLIAHEDKELEIVGSYLPSEKNRSRSPNLGLGRAAFIQSQLIAHGVDPERFISLPEVTADSLFANDTLHGGIRMRLLDRIMPLAYDSTTVDSLVKAQQALAKAWEKELQTLSALERGEPMAKGLSGASTDSLLQESQRQAQVEAWARQRTELTPLERGELSREGYDSATIESLMVARQAQIEAWARTRTQGHSITRGKVPEAQRFYFGYNRFDLVLDDQTRQYLTEVIQFMRSQRQAVLHITGHADNTGESQHNLALSKNRAETMQSFFEAFGLPHHRTQLVFQGDAQPIASNDTEQGRAQNRRVEVHIVFE